MPVLVEGASDRAWFTVFWDKPAADKQVSAHYARALDFVNCEGASLQAEMARLLCEAGKPVVAWAELDAAKELLGHARLETTRAYTRSSAEDRTRALDLLLVDE